jgi:hypothetical protein
VCESIESIESLRVVRVVRVVGVAGVAGVVGVVGVEEGSWSQWGSSCCACSRLGMAMRVESGQRDRWGQGCSRRAGGAGQPANACRAGSDGLGGQLRVDGGRESVVTSREQTLCSCVAWKRCILTAHPESCILIADQSTTNILLPRLVVQASFAFRSFALSASSVFTFANLLCLLGQDITGRRPWTAADTQG